MYKIKEIYRGVNKDAIYLSLIIIISFILTVFFTCKLSIFYAFCSIITCFIFLYKLMVIYMEPDGFEFYAIKTGVNSSAHYYIVGSSRALYFFDPILIEHHIPNKKTLMIAGYSQPFYHSYIIMKKLLKKSNTEIIFYDITMLSLYRDFGQNYETTMKVLTTPPFALFDRFIPNINYMDRILYCLHYHFPLTPKGLLSLFSMYRFKQNFIFSKFRIKKVFKTNYGSVEKPLYRTHMISKGYRKKEIKPLSEDNIILQHKRTNINLEDIKQAKIPTEYVLMLLELLEFAKKKKKQIHFIISPLYHIPGTTNKFYYTYQHLLRL